MSYIITQRPHPGPLLKTEVFKPRHLKTKQAAELFKATPNHLYMIIGRKADLSLQMCHRMEIVLGEDAEKWATRQLQYDLDKAAGGARKVDSDYFVPKNLPRIHPGKDLRNKILNPRELTAEKTGDLLECSSYNVYSMIAGQCSLTLETCLKLEKLFGENAEYWAIRQMRYDLDRKRPEVEAENLQRWKPRQGPK